MATFADGKPVRDHVAFLMLVAHSWHRLQYCTSSQDQYSQIADMGKDAVRPGALTSPWPTT